MDIKKPRRRYYFDYKGKRYYYGQKIKINRGTEVVKAMFEYCTFSPQTGKRYYVYQILSSAGTCTEENKFFNEVLVEVLDDEKNEYEQSVKEAIERAKRGPTFKDEMNIDGLAQAWILYIIAMLVSVVLNDRLTAWALSTAIFVRYRNKKLRETGWK